MPRLDRASLLAGVDRLTRRDRRLRALVTRFGPPPLWARPAGFATLLRIILEQQVSLASAKALYDSARGIGTRSRAGDRAGAGVTGLQSLGFTRQKASYCCALAAHVSDGRLPLHRLSRVPDDQALEQLMQVPGIGPWTRGHLPPDGAPAAGHLAARRPRAAQGDGAVRGWGDTFDRARRGDRIRLASASCGGRTDSVALLSVRPDRSGGVSRGDH